MCVFVKVPEENDRAPGAKVEVVVSHPTWAPQTKLEIYEPQMQMLLAAEPPLQTNSLHLIWTSPSLYLALPSQSPDGLDLSIKEELGHTTFLLKTLP